MSQSLLITTWLLPLLIMPFAFGKQIRWLSIVASVPAALAALTVQPDQQMHVSWLLLGTYLGIDAISRWLLLASACIWFVAASYAATQTTSGRFYLFFNIAMAGNFLLLLAMDMVTFYLGFALMGLSTAVLIIEQITAESRRALRLYLIWTIAGELALFSALVFLAMHSENLRFDTLSLTGVNTAVLFLIILGFGIKIALPGLHFWMPTTYASLPIAAAAVISGPMISAGVVGLIRFLAPGSGEYALIGQVLLVASAFSVCYAVVIGLMQIQARVTLAYSSMSKMGLLAAILGVALIYPSHAGVLVAAVVLFTLHHLLIKSALFLGLGFAEQSVSRAGVIAGVVLLVVSLAGVPFSSGALAKMQLGTALAEVSDQFTGALSVAAFLSLLLTVRIFYLIANSKANPSSTPGYAYTFWWLLILVILLWPWFFGQTLPSLGDIAVLLAVTFIATGVWLLKPRFLTRMVGLIPPGDLLHFFSSAAKQSKHWFHHSYVFFRQHYFISYQEHTAQWAQRLITGLLQISPQQLAWRTAGLIWLLLGISMIITMFVS